jgi:hypothetical protein
MDSEGEGCETEDPEDSCEPGDTDRAVPFDVWVGK